jgi:hypothetical protein
MESSPALWDILENSWINFSHFSEDIAHKQAKSSLTRDGIFTAYLRGRAIACKKGQEGIDLVIPMVVLPIGSALDTRVDKSHISAIILQVKNKKTDSCDFTKEKFDITHIEELEVSPTKPYLGIWMSLGTVMEDLTIESGKPIKGDLHFFCLLTSLDPAILSQPSIQKKPPRRGRPRVSKSYNDSAKDGRRPTKRGRPMANGIADDDDELEKTKLRFRLRGFRSIYNSMLPLDELERFTDRHQFPTSVSGLYYDSEFIRDASMRAFWNLSRDLLANVGECQGESAG